MATDLPRNGIEILVASTLDGLIVQESNEYTDSGKGGTQRILEMMACEQSRVSQASQRLTGKLMPLISDDREVVRYREV